jgi:uncharacterized protein (UPF0212 family)
MQVLTIKTGIQELIDAWTKAKETEKTWQEYRLQVEAAILAQYEQEIEAVRAQLSQSTQLSETVKLGVLKIALGRTLKVSQAEAALFCVAHPELVNIIMKYEYKPANSAAVLGAMHAEGQLGSEVTKLVEISDSKPSFSKA